MVIRNAPYLVKYHDQRHSQADMQKLSSTFALTSDTLQDAVTEELKSS